MSETFQIINMIVLVAAIWFGIHSLSKRDAADKKKKTYDQAEIERWERGTEIASQDKEYDPHKWYFKLPDSALKHLEACFDRDEKKVYTMKRCIELSIEHFAQEMADDAECAKIIEERVYSNPKPTIRVDIEEYKQYAKEREEHEEEFESFTQWKKKRREGI